MGAPLSTKMAKVAVGGPMADIEARLGKEVLILDGAMGTMLQRHDLIEGQSLLQLNVTAPELVEEVHRLYNLAGADCATTNTFGGSRPKLEPYGLGDQVAELNRAAVRIARASGAVHVLAEIGPTGKVLEPLGTATFDDLFAAFAEQAEALASEHPDALNIATMTDIAEARCAVLAARSVTDLPVFATCTFGLSGRMELSGTDPETAAVILEAAGASAIGLNCGLGPEQMLPLVERMARATSLPIIVRPNAGLPVLRDGVTVFPGTPEEMGRYAARFVDAGASLVGSCCGSTPAFTGAIADFAKGRAVAPREEPLKGVRVASPRRVVRIGGGAPFVRIGERINPTGKKRLAESLREGRLDVVREQAREQVAEGADLLDVNVGAPGVDQAEMLPKAVSSLSAVVDAPLVIDTTDPAALEAALRVYPGRALVNSVSGEEASLDAVLPLVKRYGAAAIVLPLDDHGVPKDAASRVAIIRRVMDRASAIGIDDDDLVADALVLAAATQEGAAAETLETIRRIDAELGLPVVAGISNVSHGLPGRASLNARFLELAAEAGLAAAIVNPSDASELDHDVEAAATDVLLGRDHKAERWIARMSSRYERPQPAAASIDERSELRAVIEHGDVDRAPALVEALVAAGIGPEEVIADILTPAIQEIGDAYGRGEVFLPQLIAAAEAMKAAVAKAKSYLPSGAASSVGRVAFGTVKGDIHSIGKDICVSMLESNGFCVDDLGVDVPLERFVEASRSADAVCLSALMTTTLPNMARAVGAVQQESDAVVLVGGAVVTQDFAESIGAGYAEDAPGCVKALRRALGTRGRDA